MIKHSILLLSTLFVCSSLFFSCSDDDDDDVGNWIEKSEVKGLRRGAVCFVINDKVYMGTGYNRGDDKYLNDFYVFDKPRDTWDTIRSFPGDARAYAIAFASSTKGYVGTGYNDNTNQTFKDFYEYDPSNDTWTKKADFKGVARKGAIAFYVDGKGYVGTGSDDDDETVRDLYSYDIDLDEWTAQASVPGKSRVYAMSFVLNGEAYVLSGLSSGSYLDDFYKYNTSSDTWTELNRLSDFDDDHSFDDDYTSIARYKGCTFVMDGLAYVTTGSIGNINNDTWEYDASTDRWDQKTSFEGPGREGALGFTINGQGYVATGGYGGYSYKDMYLFHPNEEYESKD